MNLPGTPRVDVKLNGILLDTLVAGNTKQRVLPAGATGRLGFYVASKDSLITDTLITMVPNSEQSFRIACSNTMGLMGFVRGTPPGADSVSFQLFMNLSTYYAAYPTVDIVICYAESGSSIIVDYATLPGVKNGILDSRINTLYKFNPTTLKSRTWAMYLKDPATGKVILPPRGTQYVSLISSGTATAFYVITISDNAGVFSRTLTAI